jgi:hypothetical protein
MLKISLTFICEFFSISLEHMVLPCSIIITAFNLSLTASFLDLSFLIRIFIFTYATNTTRAWIGLRWHSSQALLLRDRFGAPVKN